MSQGMQVAPQKRQRNGFCAVLQRNVAFLTPWFQSFQTFGLQNCKMINLCCLSHKVCCQCVISTMGNWDLSWQSSSTMNSTQGMQVQSQVWQLKAYMLHGVAKKGKKKETNTGRNMCPFPSHLDRSAVGPPKMYILIIRNRDYVNVTAKGILQLFHQLTLQRGDPRLSGCTHCHHI